MARKSKTSSAAVTKAVARCAECSKHARYSRYRLCLRCGKRAGWLLCTLCGRHFAPYGQKKRRCKTCARKRGGSVWTVASAGSPGLGKRA
jgi:RecJ-like exonuclease